MENESQNKDKKRRWDKNRGLNVAYQCNYFKWYVRLPLIISVLILVVFFVWGIVDPCIYERQVSRREYVYGIMGLPNGFLCWLVWMIIGVVSAAISYLFNRIVMSQKVLTVFYLQKLCGEYSEPNDNKEEEDISLTADNSDDEVQ